MPSFPPQTPAPAPSSCASHFCAREFFKDSPWLNVAPHRKAEIIIEPLYPRLGLLGGAPEASGKTSKLAALAAARKKKEAQANGTTLTSSGSQSASPPSEEEKSRSISLLDRLTAGKSQSPSSEPRTTKSSSRRNKSVPTALQKASLSPRIQPTPKPDIQVPNKTPVDTEPDAKLHHAKVNLRGDPSKFATTILGQWNKKMAPQPQLSSRKIDMRLVFGQDFTDSFNFAEPSPDDVVLKAQSAAKGLLHD